MWPARCAPAANPHPVNLRPLPLGLLLLLAAATLPAQTTESSATDPAAKRTVPQGRLPEANRADRPAKYGKAVIPDPDLLDGSSYEQEKKPLHGIISEIEMGENEGGKSDKISPNSGPAGGSQQTEDKPPAAGMASAAPKEQAAGGGEEQKVPEGQPAQTSPAASGPAAKPEGTQVANLKVPEGAAGGGGAEQNKPREQQIGDATLQIQTAQQNPQVVGTQASNSQQYEKKVPPGGSSIPSSGNTGVEKGRVVPKGL